MKTGLLLLLLFVGNVSFAQHVVINADGTHSAVHPTGNGNGIIINSNGTHSTMHSTGNAAEPLLIRTVHIRHIIRRAIIKTIFNPNGTHSTLLSSGNNTGFVNDTKNGRSYRARVSAAPSSTSHRQTDKYTDKWWLLAETDSDTIPRIK